MENMLTNVKTFPPGLTISDAFMNGGDGYGEIGGSGEGFDSVDGLGTTSRVQIDDSDFFNNFEDDFDDADVN